MANKIINLTNVVNSEIDHGMVKVSNMILENRGWTHMQLLGTVRTTTGSDIPKNHIWMDWGLGNITESPAAGQIVKNACVFKWNMVNEDIMIAVGNLGIARGTNYAHPEFVSEDNSHFHYQVVSLLLVGSGYGITGFHNASAAEDVLDNLSSVPNGKSVMVYIHMMTFGNSLNSTNISTSKSWVTCSPQFDLSWPSYSMLPNS